MDFPEEFDAQRVLGTLKDFQLRTVEHVFERMYGPDGVDRFLVADEVGLGKTLVAKGIIAKVVEQLRKDPEKRIDIVYLCANRDIARQNIDRLNLFGKDRVSQANRLTLLPLHLHALRKGPNFVAFTPGTALDLRGATGVKKERALLYWLVRDIWDASGAAAKNFFQVAVGNDKWDRQVDRVREKLDKMEKEEGVGIDPGLRAQFSEQIAGLRSRFDQALNDFKKQRERPSNVPREVRAVRDTLIGEFRECLARACLCALEPDLIILDEFQRFSSLLKGYGGEEARLDPEFEEKAQIAELGQQFLNYQGAKILLLSATPYKPYTTAADGAGEDHYKNFLLTANFLLKDAEVSKNLKQCLKAYNEALFDSSPNGAMRLREARDELERVLRRHIVRTERLAVAANRDGMVEEMLLPACRVEHQDLRAFATIDALARELEQPDALEYWKSAPYFLNFMERDGYVFKRALFERLEARQATQVDVEGFQNATLQAEMCANFGLLEPQNARLRALVAEALGRGAWKVLWIPPTLPYYGTPGTPYEEALEKSLTKILAFSSWRFVPRAVAALLSYETERRIVGLAGGQHAYDTLSTRSRRGLLRFSLDEDGDPRDLNNLIPLYPSPALCELIDPLQEARDALKNRQTLDRDGLIQIAKKRLDDLMPMLQEARAIDRAREDQQWYVAAMSQLDHNQESAAIADWFKNTPWWHLADDGDETSPVNAFQAHAELLYRLGAPDKLGRAPEDLTLVLAKAAVGSPAIVTLRALRRLARAQGVDGYPDWLLESAAWVALGFRTLFNQPDATVLTQALYGSDENRYWESVLDHCIAGNLQAVLDEHVHVLREAVGVAARPPEEAIPRIAEEIESSMGLRATILRVDDLRADPALRVMEEPIGFRCRSALRFDTDPGEDGGEDTRADHVRVAFNSPFRPFVMATTAVGQEGLDFHLWCHAVFHWHLPSNPVDFEQREGRVHRYKGHVIRKSVAASLGEEALRANVHGEDVWEFLFAAARQRRAPHETDLVPFWVYNGSGAHKIRRYIPALPLSRERTAAARLRASLGIYRMVFGQPRQEDLLAFLQSTRRVEELDPNQYGINLAPIAPSR